jgi:hypothetical protein
MEEGKKATGKRRGDERVGEGVDAPVEVEEAMRYTNQAWGVTARTLGLTDLTVTGPFGRRRGGGRELATNQSQE